MGSDSMVSQDFGAGRMEECFRTLWAGLQLALPLGVLCALLVAASGWLLTPMGIAPEIVRQAIPFPLRHGLRTARADGLCGHARLSAGDAPGEGGGLRHDFGEPHQLCGQLRADLRTLWTARAGRDRLGDFHGAVARLHAVRAAGLHGVAQPTRALASAALCGPVLPRAHRADCAAGRTGGGPDRARGGSVFGRARWWPDGWARWPSPATRSR